MKNGDKLQAALRSRFEMMETGYGYNDPTVQYNNQAFARAAALNAPGQFLEAVTSASVHDAILRNGTGSRTDGEFYLKLEMYAANQLNQTDPAKAAQLAASGQYPAQVTALLNPAAPAQEHQTNVASASTPAQPTVVGAAAETGGPHNPPTHAQIKQAQHELNAIMGTNLVEDGKDQRRDGRESQTTKATKDFDARFGLANDGGRLDATTLEAIHQAFANSHAGVNASDTVNADAQPVPRGSQTQRGGRTP